MTKATRPEPVPTTRFKPMLSAPLPKKNHTGSGARSRHQDGLRQSQALEILQGYLPDAGHIIFDAGNCAVAAIHYLSIPRNVTTAIALGMGGMGYSIAGGIGAQVGAPERSRTMVICGDGAFLMQGMEVHTAVHYRLPILFIVFNNSMHGMCVTRQQLYFDGRIECSTYPEVSILQIARGFGADNRLWTAAATCTKSLDRHLSNYLTSVTDRPGVLELKLKYEEMPPFTPFLPDDYPTFTTCADP